MIITNSRYALVGYFITSYPTRDHGIIVKYSALKRGITFVAASLNLDRVALFDETAHGRFETFVCSIFKCRPPISFRATHYPQAEKLPTFSPKCS